MTRRTTLASLLTAALLTGATACTHGGPGAAPLRWGDCADITGLDVQLAMPEPTGRDEFGCATVTLDLDPARPELGTVPVQLLKVHRPGGADVKEPLLILAGGPGQSGIDFAPYAAGMLAGSILDHFDLIAFDPRGVARSRRIDCRRSDTGHATFPDLVTATGYAAAADAMRLLAQQCATSLGAAAGLFSTIATAADLEAIRTALGLPTLSYVGWSYGAKLGAAYASLYPDRVRAAVLDAPSDPTTSSIDRLEHQVAAFERTFEQFVSWCAGALRCPTMGDVRAFVATLINDAETDPIRSGRPGDAVPTYGMDVVDAIASALYDDARWPDLADGLKEAHDGDSGTLRDLIDAGRGDPRSADAQFVINCNDSGPGPDEADIKVAAARFARLYPLFGAWASWNLFGCTFWPAERHVLPTPVAATANPLLVVGTVHDPATPYTGAVAMVASLGNARLLTWEGVGHTAVGRSDCVTAAVAAYLVSLTVPPHASRCPA